MLIALAIRRRALACAAVIGVASSCWGQTADVLAQGPTGRGERYAGLASQDQPSMARSQTAASSTPALPAWPDQTPDSVYLRGREAAEGTRPAALPGAQLPADATSHGPPAPPAATPSRDSQVSTAIFSADRDRRRLGPPHDTPLPNPDKHEPVSNLQGLVPKFGLPLDSVYTTGTALAIVVGLFLLCAWALRRGTRKSATLLPEDVVSVLGWVPLAARQFAQLVRVGNKLVLLSVTPAGAETLTEITDPVEIDRLLGLCLERQTHSSTAEFDRVFRELAKETAPDGFLGHDTMPLAARSATDSYAAYRGGADRG